MLGPGCRSRRERRAHPAPGGDRRSADPPPPTSRLGGQLDDSDISEEGGIPGSCPLGSSPSQNPLSSTHFSLPEQRQERLGANLQWATQAPTGTETVTSVLLHCASSPQGQVHALSSNRPSPLFPAEAEAGIQDMTLQGSPGRGLLRGGDGGSQGHGQVGAVS